MRRDITERLGDASEPSRRALLQALGGATAAGLLGAPTVAGERPCPGPERDAESPPAGPDVLREPLGRAPQLENTGAWETDPLLVCGSDAYVEGEYLFQSFIYDDHGTNTTYAADPPDPRPDGHTFGPMTGDVVYPTDEETYGHNAADLLEFRARPTDGGVAYRITLNTMLEPDVAAIAIGIDTDGDESTGVDDWGYGIGDLGDLGLDHVLVTWGTGAELDGEPVESTVDLERNQIEVTVPLEPGDDTWRHYLVTGLFDHDSGEFKQVQEYPDEETPGGSHGRDPPPVFEVGFRFNDQEPIGHPNVSTETTERELEHAEEERTGSRGIGYGHWREHAQAKALEEGDISEFHADIDFGKLADGVTEYNVPRTGYINRIYASRYDLGQGIGELPTSRGEDVLLGRLQPYSLYVPTDYDPDESWPFHVHLHSLTGTYNQYASFTPRFVSELGEQRGTIILTTTGRGPGVPYHDQAELDVFEAWADVAARYSLDWDRVTLGGYSMGGIGTHKLSSQYPDLFARTFPIVGSIGDEETDEVYYDNETLADNLRTIEQLMWVAAGDELVPLPLVLKYEDRLRELEYRYEMGIFPYDHLLHGYLDEWGPAVDFLAEAGPKDEAPAHVTYRAVPEMDNEELDLVHDEAYWLSELAVVEDERSGLLDARSLAVDEPEPIPEKFEEERTEPEPHVARGIRWRRELVDEPTRNAIELDLEALSGATLWVEDAGIDPSEPIELAGESTHEATVRLESSVGAEDVDVPAGEFEITVDLCGYPEE